MATQHTRAQLELPDYFDPPLGSHGSPSPLTDHVLIVTAHDAGDLDEEAEEAAAAVAVDALGGKWVCLSSLLGWDRWRLPHGVAWHDLPMPLDAMTTPGSSSRTCHLYGAKGPAARYAGTAPLAHALSDPRETLVAMPAARFPGIHGVQRARLLLARCADMLEAAGVIGRLHLLDADGVRPTDLQGLREACAPAEPWRRFVCSWHFNFLAIGRKALEHALSLDAQGDLSSGGDAAARKDHGSQIWHARHMASHGPGLSPLALQVLYEIARRGETDVSACLGPYGDPVSPVLESIMLGEDGVIAWRGTGKHPAFPLHPIEAVNLWRGLEELCLVEIVGGAMRLAPAGGRFLDALHPDCEDRDLPCRWTHRELGPDDRKALDASLMRTFCKMKTRVNALRA